MQIVETREYKQLQQLLDRIQKKYKIDPSEAIIQAQEKIPISIFSGKLSPLESITKYLKQNYTITQIAKQLNRSTKTIWQASKKQGKIKIRFSEHDIPLTEFKKNKLSILETITLYLKNKGLKLSEIAKLLNKNPRTIWTCYNRAKKK
jgi:DNA-binding CsgD family transcriptional regulator